VLQQHGIREIVHTAAMSHPTPSLEFPIATFAAKVDPRSRYPGARDGRDCEWIVAFKAPRLLETARLAGVKRVVNFSSEVVYGAVDGP
jgi:hypothetical protein